MISSRAESSAIWVAIAPSIAGAAGVKRAAFSNLRCFTIRPLSPRTTPVMSPSDFAIDGPSLSTSALDSLVNLSHRPLCACASPAVVRACPTLLSACGERLRATTPGSESNRDNDCSSPKTRIPSPSSKSTMSVW